MKQNGLTRLKPTTSYHANAQMQKSEAERRENTTLPD